MSKRLELQKEIGLIRFDYFTRRKKLSGQMKDYENNRISNYGRHFKNISS